MSASFTLATDISASLTKVTWKYFSPGITTVRRKEYRRLFEATSICPIMAMTESPGTNNLDRPLFEVTWCLEPAAGVSNSRNDH